MKMICFAAPKACGDCQKSATIVKSGTLPSDNLVGLTLTFHPAFRASRIISTALLTDFVGIGV